MIEVVFAAPIVEEAKDEAEMGYERILAGRKRKDMEMEIEDSHYI